MSVVIPQRGLFPSGQFKAIAVLMWKKFFEMAPAECDVAHWLIQPNSAHIRVTPRISTVHEGIEWEPPVPIIAQIEGVIDALNEGANHEDQVIANFEKWASWGILEAFQSAAIAKKLQAFAGDRSFAIVSSPVDEGLREDPLKLIWSSSKKFNLAAIAKNQQAAEAKEKRKPKVVVKKAVKKAAVKNKAVVKKAGKKVVKKKS